MSEEKERSEKEIRVYNPLERGYQPLRDDLDASNPPLSGSVFLPNPCHEPEKTDEKGD